eukprot:TRINITY_DN22183_c0_g1_i1.p1 TRINITY_DN22183_c0_g1~~TRINITY_DN22183_c0_g1_i1.p1  ORF type:complete len:144 (+),score=26.51 TRINITY_DN22183_c0_g1_i1:65-496(+)
MGIKYILVQNKQGKTRVAKWYVAYDDEEKMKLMAEVRRVVGSRGSKFTNFVEFLNHKIVYRRYAGLYFCFAIDLEDNALAIFEAIHLFVEILDVYFGNVCELDLVFNFHKVYAVLDELILAGEIMETNKTKILERLTVLDKED